MSVLPHESPVRAPRALHRASPGAGGTTARRAHQGLRSGFRRAGTTALVLGLAAALTGCSAQGQGPTGSDLASASPGSGTTAPADTPAPGGERTTAAGTCFDVIEVYTGLVLLPITTRDSAGTGPDAGARGGVSMAEAQESIRSHRDGLPAAVRPAFDGAVRLLQKAGDSLQPQEAAQLQRSLEPVESWISEQCSAAAPGG